MTDNQSEKDIPRPKNFRKDLKGFGKDFIKLIPTIVIFIGVMWFLDSTVWDNPHDNVIITTNGDIVRGGRGCLDRKQGFISEKLFRVHDHAAACFCD